MNKISVIVPVYNAETYLRETLDSLVSQSLKDIEIIIINDGSKDGSAAIIKEYIKKYEGIYYVERENRGISFTRNQGIKLANGKYIMFLDSDDLLQKDACENLYNAIEKSDSDVVVCDFEEFSNENRIIRNIVSFNQTDLKTSPNLLFDINSSPWNKIYNRQFLLEHDIYFPDGLKYEDAYFVLKVLCKAKKISKLDETLVKYRVHPGSETTSMNAKVYDIFEIISMIEKEVNATCPSDELKLYLEFFVINRLTVYNIQQAYQKDENMAKQFVLDSFDYLDKHYPNWRKNPYFNQNNGLAKKIIKKNKAVTLLMNKMMRRRR